MKELHNDESSAKQLLQSSGVEVTDDPRSYEEIAQALGLVGTQSIELSLLPEQD
jgi:hypothetical protein